MSKAVSRAFFDLGRYEDARQLYEKVYSANHGDNEAFKGVLYCLLKTVNYAAVRHLTNEAQIEKTLSPNVIILLNADLLEKEQDYTNVYTGYLEYLRVESNEALLKEAQDKRKAVLNNLLLSNGGLSKIRRYVIRRLFLYYSERYILMLNQYITYITDINRFYVRKNHI